jgi:ATP-binding cassette subfamily A (ABC1) protein 3
MIAYLCGALSYSFSLSTYCGSIVLEREKKLKYALNVMGCRKVPYWLGTFAFDYIVFFVVSLYFILFSVIFDISIFKGHYGELVALLIVMGFSLLAWCYVLSFMFSQAASAYRYLIWINYFISCAFCQIINALARNTGVNGFLVVISPFFTLMYAIYSFGFY